MSYQQDKQILQELGNQVAEIAALPVQQELKHLWKRLNGLKPERPMFMIDQIPWHEMNVNDELTLQCEDEFYRTLELDLRKRLYKWHHMRDDGVIEPIINVHKAIRGANFGIRIEEQVLALDASNDVTSHRYDDQLQTWEDLEKIKMPTVSLDESTTNVALEKAHDVFDGLLAVRSLGYVPYFSPWDLIAQWRGVEAPLIDILDRPDFTHAMLERITQAYLSMLDQLQEQALLPLDHSTVHCTGAWTEELPAAGHNPDKPRTQDIWTFGMAQMFSTVSPAMHDEFEIQYAKRWYDRFGLGYYGCCEPLDRKIDIIRKIPHVRKISMSPWTNKERGAEAIGPDFVFSSKPNPSYLVATDFTTENAETELSTILSACQRHNCPVEFILKDISTVLYKPQRLWQWAEMASRLVGKG